MEVMHTDDITIIYYFLWLLSDNILFLNIIRITRGINVNNIKWIFELIKDIASLLNDVAWSLRVKRETWKKTAKIFLNTICKLNQTESNVWIIIPTIKFPFLLKTLIKNVIKHVIGIKKSRIVIKDNALNSWKNTIAARTSKYNKDNILNKNNLKFFILLLPTYYNYFSLINIYYYTEF